MCNACGLYFKLHNKHRPSSMKNPLIKRRKRIPQLPDLPKLQSPKLDKFDSLVVSQHIAQFGSSLIHSSQSLNSGTLRDILNSTSSFQAFVYDALLKLESPSTPPDI